MTGRNPAVTYNYSGAVCPDRTATATRRAPSVARNPQRNTTRNDHRGNSGLSASRTLVKQHLTQLLTENYPVVSCSQLAPICHLDTTYDANC